jgi:hypothetical protein
LAGLSPALQSTTYAMAKVLTRIAPRRKWLQFAVVVTAVVGAVLWAVFWLAVFAVGESRQIATSRSAGIGFAADVIREDVTDHLVLDSSRHQFPSRVRLNIQENVRLARTSR